MAKTGLSHAIRQFRKFTAADVEPGQFKKRIRKCEACTIRDDLKCKQFGRLCASLAGDARQSCDNWHERKTHSPVESLAVVACYFNPCDSVLQRENLERFRAELRAPITIIEASFNGDFVFDDSVKIIATEKNRYLWQKERLLKIAIDQLPATVDAFAMVDADLIFRNKNWQAETLARLQNADVVQMFESIEYIAADGNLEIRLPSFAWEQQQAVPSPGLPGGAVAVRRATLDRPGGALHETNIIGGGDGVTMRRWKKQGLVIDYVRGAVVHLYHGKYSERGAIERYEVLRENNFDPAADVRVGENGLFEWSSPKPALHSGVKKYFERRAAGLVEAVKAPPVAAQKKQFVCDVFIPYHTGLEFVAEAVNSILWQKDVKTVIHLVNDQSPEDDGFLFEKFGAVDNIRWYKTNENVGPYRICNALVSKMETDYFAMMGSDDVSLPSRFVTSFGQMEKDCSEIFFAAMENFLTPQAGSDAATPENLSYLASRPDYVSSLSGPLVNGTMLISRRAFEFLNGYENVFCGGDTEFGERLKQSGLKISISQEKVALRRIHGKNLSLSSGPRGKNSQERAEIAQRWAERFAEWRREGFDVKKYGGLQSVGEVLKKNIGTGTKIWAGVSVSPGAIIGDGCTIARGVEIGPGVVIGDRVKIQAGCFIPSGVTIADDVFIGPNCTFANDKYPPSGGKHWSPVVVDRGASIGAAAVILPGVTIGANAAVGAAAVVTRDVAPNSTGYGHPYREQSREAVTIGIATYPPRLAALLETLASLEGQADVVHVCLNEYNTIPFELARMKNVVCTIPEKNLNDIGKFLQLPSVDGYFLSCDDDLIYPPEYVESMITAARRHGGAVSHLGRVFPVDRPCNSYYRDVVIYRHCLRAAGADQRVHVGGTGVMCFHTRDVKFRIDDRDPPGMADIHFGVYAARHGVPITALQHAENWIRHTDKIDVKETLWFQYKDDDSEYTNALNKTEWTAL